MGSTRRLRTTALAALLPMCALLAGTTAPAGAGGKGGVPAEDREAAAEQRRAEAEQRKAEAEQRKAEAEQRKAGHQGDDDAEPDETTPPDDAGPNETTPPDDGPEGAAGGAATKEERAAEKAARRQAIVERITQRIADDPHLDEATKAALLARIQEVAATGTPGAASSATAHAAAAARAVAAARAAEAAVARLDQGVVKLVSLVEQAGAAGLDTAAIEALLADARARLDAAAAALAGIVLPDDPTAPGTTGELRQRLGAVRAELGAVLSTLQQAADALRVITTPSTTTPEPSTTAPEPTAPETTAPETTAPEPGAAAVPSATAAP